ncbi:unnamed protein product [Lampetra fluviatilis]
MESSQRRKQDADSHVGWQLVVSPGFDSLPAPTRRGVGSVSSRALNGNISSSISIISSVVISIFPATSSAAAAAAASASTQPLLSSRPAPPAMPVSRAYGFES